MTTTTYNSIAQRFNAAATTYDRAANVQQRVAQQLFGVYQSASQQPPRHIIEAGCGTGFLTQHLCHHFPDVPLLALDIAPGMVALCRHRLTQYPHLHCQVADAEQLPPNCTTDLLISNLCMQWFSDWRAGLSRWAQVAHTIAFSVPIAGSFAHWVEAHAQTGQPDGLHPLPDAQALRTHCAQLGVLQHFSIQNEILHHTNALDFARTLRAIGASQPRSGHHPVNLRRVLRQLPQGIDAEYRIAYCVIEVPQEIS